jgi:hypothetical protein
MNNYKKGFCDKCNGWIQFDKVNQYYYCMDCHKLWDEDTWNALCVDKKDDYKWRDESDNLKDLNNFGR